MSRPEIPYHDQDHGRCLPPIRLHLRFNLRPRLPSSCCRMGPRNNVVETVPVCRQGEIFSSRVHCQRWDGCAHTAPSNPNHHASPNAVAAEDIPSTSLCHRWFVSVNMITHITKHVAEAAN